MARVGGPCRPLWVVGGLGWWTLEEPRRPMAAQHAQRLCRGRREATAPRRGLQASRTLLAT